ncbi:DUF4337 family protein [beta proteobacterium MWH-UniP1]
MPETNDTASQADQFEKRISITISGVAVLLLLNSMGAGNASSEAAFQNTVAINTYAFYQAKTIRQNDLELAANALDTIVDTAVPAINSETKKKAKEIAVGYRAKASSYDSDPTTSEGKKELLEKARNAEQQRDSAMEKGPYFDLASLLLQLAVILFSVVLLTKKKTLLLAASATAVTGGFFTLNAFFMLIKIPGLG